MNSIRTKRLLLRPASQEDLDALHRVFADPAAMKYWSTLPHSDIAQTATYINDMIATPLSRGEDFVVALDGQVIGKAGFWEFPEIGFLFHPDSWGMGLGSEAVSALVAHGFEERGLPKITADVDPRNGASIRLLEKLGFTETHRKANTFKIGDEWCDSVYFALEAQKA